METARSAQKLEIWAYVIMPEHVHMLVYPARDTYDMGYILAALKRPVSTAARACLKATQNWKWLEKLSVRYPSRDVFRFWQPGGGYDRNIFNAKSLVEVIDYIHLNPVRRELVRDPLDWKWSSARFWEGWPDVPIRMDEPIAD